MEQYNPGDEVTMTADYRSNYPAWKVFGQVAKVLSSKKTKIKMPFSSKESKQMYVGRYGMRDEYFIYEIIIELNGGKFMVSQFGFVKDPDDKE